MNKAKKGTKQMVAIYHIFSDHKDDFTRDSNEALELFELYKQSSENVRLYMETYASEEDYENNVMEDEECLEAIGAYPA